MSPSTDVASFHTYLSSARRIVALCGAGLSASSGLPTFRGAGGMWRNYDVMRLATPEAFRRDPGLVWQFYSMRRHMALQVAPNKAHYALAELARKHPAFLTLTQNVDGLSVRANHPNDSIRYLHGSLFALRCSGYLCEYVDDQNFVDPIVPSLAVPMAKKTVAQRAPGPASGQSDGGTPTEETLVYDESVELQALQLSDLPVCPKCQKDILRPGVVWFGENLDSDMMDGIEHWLEQPADLCIVIGTSGLVYPAAGYAHRVKELGGKVAIVDLDVSSGGWSSNIFDWVFEGDATKIVPEILKPIIGDM